MFEDVDVEKVQLMRLTGLREVELESAKDEGGERTYVTPKKNFIWHSIITGQKLKAERTRFIYLVRRKENNENTNEDQRICRG